MYTKKQSEEIQKNKFLHLINIYYMRKTFARHLGGGVKNYTYTRQNDILTSNMFFAQKNS